MAAAQAQVPNDSSDEELGQPLNAPGVSSTQAPGNPFPLSPAASPGADPRMILEQLAATTQLLSNIVLNQHAQLQAQAAAAATSTISTSGFSDANKILNRPERYMCLLIGVCTLEPCHIPLYGSSHTQTFELA